MRIRFWIVIGLASIAFLIIVGLMVYALPATLSLPRGPRPGIEELTLEEAAAHIRNSGDRGLDLVEKARLLVGERIEYCRRNSFDSYHKAFRRGYGYCQQEAYSLARLLRHLGFNAWPVHCEHCDFPDKKNTGHAWVQVFYQGKVYDIDSKYMDHVNGELLFTTSTPVKRYNVFFRILSGWGCTAANAYRYYRTGSDHSASY